jgi:hypothetical protein
MPATAISNWLAWTPESASINQGKNTRRDVNEDVQQHKTLMRSLFSASCTRVITAKYERGRLKLTQ